MNQDGSLPASPSGLKGILAKARRGKSESPSNLIYSNTAANSSAGTHPLRDSTDSFLDGMRTPMRSTVEPGADDSTGTGTKIANLIPGLHRRRRKKHKTAKDHGNAAVGGQKLEEAAQSTTTLGTGDGSFSDGSLMTSDSEAGDEHV
jgi:hypothetical protein